MKEAGLVWTVVDSYNSGQNNALALRAFCEFFTSCSTFFTFLCDNGALSSDCTLKAYALDSRDLMFRGARPKTILTRVDLDGVVSRLTYSMIKSDFRQVGLLRLPSNQI